MTPVGSPDVFSTIRRHRHIVIGAAVLGMLLAWVLSAMRPQRYRATVLTAVAPAADSMNASEVLRGVEVLEQRTVVATLAALAMTDAIIGQAAGGSADGVTVHSAVVPNTNLVRLDVDAADAARASAVASRLPAILGAQARAMYRLYGVTAVAPPSQPNAAGSQSGRAVLAGLLAGLIIGALIAFALDRLRPAPVPA